MPNQFVFSVPANAYQDIGLGIPLPVLECIFSVTSPVLTFPLPQRLCEVVFCTQDFERSPDYPVRIELARFTYREESILLPPFAGYPTYGGLDQRAVFLLRTYDYPLEGVVYFR